MVLKNWSFFLNEPLPLSFEQDLKPSKTAQEGPVPAKSFSGAVDPSVSLKVLTGVPTLKATFAASMQDAIPPPSQKQVKPKNCGKFCTGYFGCTNIAVSQEVSANYINSE